jgi:DNA-binding MarR family transcriptional regulator
MYFLIRLLKQYGCGETVMYLQRLDFAVLGAIAVYDGGLPNVGELSGIVGTRRTGVRQSIAKLERFGLVEPLATDVYRLTGKKYDEFAYDDEDE